MRILVAGATLGAEDRRLAVAASGLAARGHQVLWLGGSENALIRGADLGAGGATPHRAGPIHLDGWRGLLGGVAPRADLVLGAARHTVRTAFAGWLAGARAMGLTGDPRTGADFLSRWCWESLDGFRIVDAEADLEEAHTDIEPERWFRWSEEAIGEPLDPDHADCEVLERACERWLARRNGAGSPAVFLDRDGTLVVERGYLADPDHVELLPGVPQALRELRASGYSLVVVSNQSGVGRGFFPRRRVFEAMARLRTLLRPHAVELDAIYFCPHRPEAGCACRKPGTELLERAAENLNLSLERSVMIGDKLLDVATGHRGRALGVLVRTGYGSDELERLPNGELDRPPDFVARSLVEAARWLAARQS